MKQLPAEQTLLEWLALAKEAEQKAKELCNLTTAIDEKWRIRLESTKNMTTKPHQK